LLLLSPPYHLILIWIHSLMNQSRMKTMCSHHLVKADSISYLCQSRDSSPLPKYHLIYNFNHHTIMTIPSILTLQHRLPSSPSQQRSATLPELEPLTFNTDFFGLHKSTSEAPYLGDVNMSWSDYIGRVEQWWDAESLQTKTETSKIEKWERKRCHS
jgi:hypothetical protein